MRFRKGLVIAEVALSFVLLIGAGLLIESFRRLTQVDTGFDTSNLLTMRIGFEGAPQVKAAQVKQELQAIPGIKAVALSSVIPFSPGGGAVFYSAEGEAPLLDPAAAPRALIHFISEGFFETMKIPLRYGRDFNNSDNENAVIVSERLVQRFWPNQDPIGKRIRVGRDNPDNPWLTIIGVAANTRTRGIPENPTADPDLYFQFSRFGGRPGILIRTEASPVLMTRVVVEAIKSVDKLSVISNIATMEELVRPQTARARFLGSISGAFSGIALALALVGIYGSVSYSVGQRTREMGVRAALGARQIDLLTMVLRQTFATIGTGLVIGIIASFAASLAISTLLFEVRTTEPSVFVITALLLVVTSLGASYIPARRASQIDPVQAIRQN